MEWTPISTTPTDEREALAALTRLGLTSYEAEVFLALQKLGAGTARDVDRITDVPRSQVYGAAEGLEERGLVDVQQSNPMEYRPVSHDEARSRLTEQLERDRDAAMEYVESVESQRADTGEERDDIWTVRGREAVSDRVGQLIGEADRRIVFGARYSDLVTDGVERRLREAAAEGLTVVVSSESADVRDRFADADGIAVLPGAEGVDFDETGRLLIADDATLLLSVLGEEELPGIERETAFWSRDSGFAVVLIRMVEQVLGEPEAL